MTFVEVCTCGHVLDEHEDTMLMPCDIDGCPCIAYDEDETDET